MKRRGFIISSSAATLPLLAAGAGGIRGERPSVILIVTDDQGYGDLSCHGNPS